MEGCLFHAVFQGKHQDRARVCQRRGLEGGLVNEAGQWLAGLVGPLVAVTARRGWSSHSRPGAACELQAQAILDSLPSHSLEI